MAEDSSSIIVFAGSSTEAAIVRSYLESNGIASRLVNEHIGTMGAAPGCWRRRAPSRSSSRVAMP